MLRKNQPYLLFAITVFIALSCAKIVTPTGGPKDITPPQITSSDPENYTTNFRSKEVVITFDEFIQLKDVNKSLIISPPLEEKPMVRVKGKSLVIRFESELKDSTTYNLYFGESLQDFNEGNPYKNFQYVLSTGGFIDSLSIEGSVLNSSDLLPVENVYVMLYSEVNDSVPYKQIPEYISKTDKKGFFRINNVRNTSFKIFALKDGNNNYLFDVNSEPIGFTDSLITFKLETVTKTDTIFKNDENANDQQPQNKELTQKTTAVKIIDTIITYSKLEFPVKNYTLLLFTEDYETQYLKNNKRDEKFKLEYVFNKPVKDSIVFNLLDNPKATYLKEINTKRDTFIFWLTDTLDYNKPELSTTISYQKPDSLKIIGWVTDTLKMKFIESTKTKKDDKNKDKEEETKTLSLSFNFKNNSTFDLNTNISFACKTPFEKIDTTKLFLFTIVDSIETGVPVNLKNGKNSLHELTVTNQFTENTKYRFEAYPGAFRDIYGTINDTIIMKFTTQKLDYYGKLLANITGLKTEEDLLVQLILPGKKEEEIIIAEKKINKDQIVEFSYLPPKEFTVKLVFDKNNNGTWDTGNYLNHLQPEEVIYYEKPAKIRSNWDVEISIDLTKRK
ncbi:MAG: Ig-like domain-containing protein [Bacteroidales bacterium]